MFNLSAIEIFVILAAALIVLGPERLPGAARKIGQIMGQVRDLSTNFQREVNNAMNDFDPRTEKPHTRPHLLAIDGGRDSDATDSSSTDSGSGFDVEDPVDESVSDDVSEPASPPTQAASEGESTPDDVNSPDVTKG